MEFTVTWSSEAFESLDRIFEVATDRKAIVRAIHGLHEELSSEPGTKGESRPGGKRIIFSPPLGASFKIRWRLNQVLVGEVWHFDQHGSAQG